MRWEGINGCQWVSFFSHSSLTRLRWSCDWCRGSLQRHSPLSRCTRAACQTVFAVLFTDGPQGRLSGPESVFASSSQIISRRTSWRLRSLAGGCSDCQKHLKTSNFQSMFQSVLIFKGNRANGWTDRRLSWACRSVWDVWSFIIKLPKLKFSLNIKELLAGSPDRLDFYHVLVSAHQLSPVRHTTESNPQSMRRCRI